MSFVFGKIFVGLLFLILLIQLGIYIYRTRSHKKKIVKFLANTVKNKLGSLGGTEYPLDFMLEDIVDFVSDLILKTRKHKEEYSASNINSTVGNNSNSPLSNPSRYKHTDEPSSYLKDNNNNSSSSNNILLTEIDLNFEPYFVKKIWKEIQTEVNNDVRVQMVTVMYHGINRKCWRRLDKVPRISTSIHKPTITKSNIDKVNQDDDTHGEHDNVYDHWAQSIVGRPSTARGTPVMRTTTVKTGF